MRSLYYEALGWNVLEALQYVAAFTDVRHFIYVSANHALTFLAHIRKESQCILKGKNDTPIFYLHVSSYKY